MKHLLTDLRGDIDANTIILGDLNTSLTPIDRSKRLKLRETTELTQTIELMDLVEIYRTFGENIQHCTIKHRGQSPSHH